MERICDECGKPLEPHEGRGRPARLHPWCARARQREYEADWRKKKRALDPEYRERRKRLERESRARRRAALKGD